MIEIDRVLNAKEKNKKKNFLSNVNLIFKTPCVVLSKTFFSAGNILYDKMLVQIAPLLDYRLILSQHAGI